MTSKKKKVFSRASVILAAFIIAGLFDILGFGMVNAYAGSAEIKLGDHRHWVELPESGTRYYTLDASQSSITGSPSKTDDDNLSIEYTDGSYNITLLKNIDLEVSNPQDYACIFFMGGTIQLDLNGHSLTIQLNKSDGGGALQLADSASLTVTGSGTLNCIKRNNTGGDCAAIMLDSNTSFIVDGSDTKIELSAAGSSGNLSAVRMGSGAVFNLKRGSVKINDGNYTSGLFTYCDNQSTPVITVYGNAVTKDWINTHSCPWIMTATDPETSGDVSSTAAAAQDTSALPEVTYKPDLSKKSDFPFATVMLIFAHESFPHNLKAFRVDETTSANCIHAVSEYAKAYGGKKKAQIIMCADVEPCQQYVQGTPVLLTFRNDSIRKGDTVILNVYDQSVTPAVQRFYTGVSAADGTVSIQADKVGLMTLFKIN